MKTILIATDFSPAALNASNYAADMALAISADVLLLHVYSIPVNYSEIPVAMSLEEMQQNADKEINELREQLIKKAGGKINVATEVRTGVFFQELKTVCESIKPYTVVMGSQGTTATERLFFGSHAVYAMKNLQWPLITVPQGAMFSSVKKIGLTCDFDKVVDTIPVDEIKMLVNDFGAQLHVLNTGKEKEFNPELVFESGLLQEMLVDLKPEYHFITNRNTEQGIIDFAEKNHIELLIVVPKRHGLLDRLVHKSHTKQFVLHSHVPVMALH
ncbi:MAG TPA: universal stress protein [Chitinophagaceae bacterium]|nr:universal stress protein [Chitinophagaceae bacterium]